MPHAHKACKKRCIPKEGMPHAHKACQKEEEEEKDSPYPRKKRGRKRDRANEVIHHPPNKNYPHTCTS